jgi:phosphatidylserine decarboxylase
VNATSVQAIPNLFCTNERLVSYLSTAAGRLAVVKVGATCVGRLRATYDETATRGARKARRQHYPRPIPVAKGEEIGVFEMGSTVILLSEPGRLALDGTLGEGSRVRMGQEIGRVVE